MPIPDKDFAAMFRTAPAKVVEAWNRRKARILPSRNQMSKAQQGIPVPDAKWAYQDVLWNAHSRGFFVARVARVDVLNAIHDQVNAAVREGISFQEFRNRLQPNLEKMGWWSGTGNKEGYSLVRNPKTAEDEWTRLGTPRRLRTIYETNLSVSYSAGHYAQMKAASQLLPWWRYVAIMDKRTRPAHAALHDHIWRHDDPVWSSIWPPNAWKCRCRVEPCTEREARGTPGYVVQDQSKTQIRQMRVGANGPMVPVQGVLTGNGTWFYPDPAWAYNPGMYGKSVEHLAWDRVQTLQPRAQRSFVNEISGNSGLLTERKKMFEAWTQAVQDTVPKSGVPQRVTAGWMPSDLIDQVKEALNQGKSHSQIIDAMSPLVSITDEQAWHARRPGKPESVKTTLKQFLELPEVIANPWAADWDQGDLLLYSQPRMEGTERRVTRFVLRRSTVTGSMEVTTATVVPASEANKQSHLIARKKP